MNMSVPIIRVSERKAFKRCPQMWWWAWREGLISKSFPVPALWFGTGVHLALAAWYCGPGIKRGPHPAETWMAYCGEEIQYIKTFDPMDDTLAKYEDGREMGRVLLEEYVKKYGRDEHKLYIQPEQTWTLDIPWGDRQALYDMASDLILAEHVGTYDGAWRHADTGWIWLD
jgi:hypothetical protein